MLFVVITLLFGEGKDPTDESAQDVINYYKDNDDKQTIAAILVGFAGLIVFAAGAIVSATIHLVLADYSNNLDVIDPLVFQTLNAFEYNFWMFFPVGLGSLLLASGISSVRHGTFPKWVGWLGVGAGILFLTPVFFVGFVLAPLWILIVSIIGISRARAGGPASATS